MNYLKLRKINKLYFPYQELSGALGITARSARVFATRYAKQGYLVRFRRNFYMLKERWDALDTEDVFRLANLMEVPSYISLTTALGYHEITTQIQRDFFESISLKRTKEITVGEKTFTFTRIDPLLYGGFEKINGYFIATPEKALLDAIYLSSVNKYNIDIDALALRKINRKRIKNLIKKYPKNTVEFWRKYVGSV